MSAIRGSDMYWSKRDEWKLRGKDFMIVVSRHEESSCLSYEGDNRWCVYAYIYPKHPHFSEFSGPSCWQDAANAMPLHGGATLLDYPARDGSITSVHIGADYNHLHDDSFTFYATKKDAYEVFNDAGELFDWLQARAIQASQIEEATGEAA